MKPNKEMDDVEFEKHIINIERGVDKSTALQLVVDVIMQGRVSSAGESYCYLTRYPQHNLCVSCRRNKSSDTFNIVFDEINKPVTQ